MIENIILNIIACTLNNDNEASPNLSAMGVLGIMNAIMQNNKLYHDTES